MSEKVGKTPQVIIRVSVKDKQLIKDLGGNFADIWRFGFEKWLEKIPNMSSELQKKREYLEKMLLQCNDKIAQCNNVVITQTRNLETLETLGPIYIGQGRSIDNPTEQDLYWIESRTKDLKGVSVEKFLEYCKSIPDVKREELKTTQSYGRYGGGSDWKTIRESDAEKKKRSKIDQSQKGSDTRVIK